MTNAGIAPGYDDVHPEFLNHLGSEACAWLSKLFLRIMATNTIPNMWRTAKEIAMEKNRQ